MDRRTFQLALAALATVRTGTSTAQEKRVVIGHFGTPLPFQAAAAAGAFDKATGWKIDWRKFESSKDALAALAAGDVKMAEIGSSPLAIGATQGADVQLVALSNVIGSAEALVARNGAGVGSVRELKGKKVAVPPGSTAHYSLLGALAAAGMKASDVTIVSMRSDQIPGAWEEGAIDATFIWEPSRSKVLKTGRQLLHAGEVKGRITYDGWVVHPSWGSQHRDFIVTFIGVQEAANRAYLANPAKFTASAPEVKAIASATGVDAERIPVLLRGYLFPTIAEQASWFVLSAATTLASTAEFLKENKRTDKALANFDRFVNASYLQAALK